MTERRADRDQLNRREQVLRFLRERDEAADINEIATHLRVHVNTVRFHLESLLDQGLVARAISESKRPGRPPQLFVAVPAMDPAGPRNYALLAGILAAGYGTSPAPRQQAIEAGRTWGQRETVNGESTETHNPVDKLMTVLDGLDFAPELHESDRDALPVIGLRHCPFLDLVDTHADIICPIHLGLMRGVLEARDAHITVDRLEPFAQPDLCTVHLEFTEAP